MQDVLVIIALTLTAAAISAFSQYLFKRNVKEFAFSIKGMMTVLRNRYTLLGLGMYFVSFLLYIYALHIAPIISFVYPVFASTFIFVLLISKFVLHEKTTLPRVLGLCLIILGITLVSLTYPM
ncbi:4-amino-4-deoxy-L-arabinose-phosphoundecaprenol flippase subunit ArnE [uncultured archaeon]|nr:4-amino-4-deoxy-L-arabinose-phosphoundecaprenol flippase subunit ArnE [uncultured archaeon]